MLGRAPRFPLEVGCEGRSWWLWAQGLETRRNCGTGLSIPCGLASGSKRCYHIRVLKAKWAIDSEVPGFWALV